MSIIKRNNTLPDLLKYWSHNNPSNIGVGRLSRKINNEGVYLISKTGGREDLASFNVKSSIIIDGVEICEEKSVQLSFGPHGVYYNVNTPATVKQYIAKWVKENKSEICIQIHFLKWFNNVEIKDNTLEETISILESYSYNEEEADVLFSELVY